MTFQRLTVRRLAWLSAFVAGSSAAVVRAAEAGHEEYQFRSDLAFWSLVTFLLFVWVIRKLGWGSFVDGLTAREQREASLVARAEQTNRDAQELLREHKGRMEAIDEEVRELIAEAHRDAEYTRGDILAIASQEADTLRQRALTEIQRTRDQALDEIFSTLTARVASATEQRLAARLTPGDQNRLIEEALSQFATQRA